MPLRFQTVKELKPPLFGVSQMGEVAEEAIDRCRRKRIRDWSAIKTAIKNDLSGYLYKTTKRNPMILPVIMEI